MRAKIFTWTVGLGILAVGQIVGGCKEIANHFHRIHPTPSPAMPK